MRKHLKPLLAFFLFFALLFGFCYLVATYPNVMMWVTFVIVAVMVYAAAYKIFNN